MNYKKFIAAVAAHHGISEDVVMKSHTPQDWAKEDLDESDVSHAIDWWEDELIRIKSELERMRANNH